MKSSFRLIALIAGISMSLLGALELGLRAYDIVTGNVLPSNSQDLVYRSEIASHPYLRYTARPNFSGQLKFIEPFQTFSVQTNGFGFRGREFYPKAPGKFRILVLGDSFTFGFNANQNETYPAVLESLAHEQGAAQVEVLNLGIASYSTLRYAVLARTLFDYLSPDLVIVSVDQSDFEEDLVRENEYLFDEKGYPVILKEHEFLESARAKEQTLAMDGAGKFLVNKSVNWRTRLMFGSSLFRHLAEMGSGWKIRRQNENYLKTQHFLQEKKLPVVRYEDLVAKYGENIKEGIPHLFYRNMIPLSLARAKQAYQPSFKALELVARKCRELGAPLYLASYPYPWMVSVTESARHQMGYFGTMFDFRGNRVHPQLMDFIATRLGVEHINAYPRFEADTHKRFGDEDPHMNAYGYRLYAQVLWEGIRLSVKRAHRISWKSGEL